MFYDSGTQMALLNSHLFLCSLYTSITCSCLSYIVVTPWINNWFVCGISLFFFWIQDYHAVDILLAEIDVYELFAFKHCVGRRIQLALCKGTLQRHKIWFFWNYSTKWYTCSLVYICLLKYTIMLLFCIIYSFCYMVWKKERKCLKYILIPLAINNTNTVCHFNIALGHIG